MARGGAMKCPFEKLDCAHYRIAGCRKRFWAHRRPDEMTCYVRDPKRAKKLVNAI